MAVASSRLPAWPHPEMAAAAEDDASSAGVPASSRASSVPDEERAVLDELDIDDGDYKYDYRRDEGEADRRRAVFADRERRHAKEAAAIAAAEAAKEGRDALSVARDVGMHDTQRDAKVGGDLVGIDALKDARPMAGECVVCELDATGVVPCHRCRKPVHADCGHAVVDDGASLFCSRLCASAAAAAATP